MSEWKEIPLGELATFKTGKLDSNAATENGAYPFFTCSRDTFRTDTYSFDDEVVLLAGNNANGVFPLKYFKGKFDAYQRTYVIRPIDTKFLSTRYLYYVLRPQLDHLRSISTGAATKFLTMGLLNSLSLPVPPLAEQKRIAGILSAYDELIENNLRRIKILEDMAQSLYREWFVHFRFPGHQDTPLTDSPQGPIPQGWEVKKLKDVTSKIGSGATPKGGKDAYKSEGISLIRSLNIFDHEFKHKNLAFIDDAQAKKLNNVIVEENDVLLNITGASVARCTMVPPVVLPARVNQHVAIIRANQDCDSFYILDGINSDERKRAILAMAQGGATREALTKTTLNNLEFVIPPSAILQRYSSIRRSLFDEHQTLAHKNQNLRSTRDLLLPKLLTPSS
ncbi:restriction endonuclease subunit S [Rubritalea profundi]|uniref:Type I restriction modification DNA specificity domain-containing protein n=1 Tax=Rubritalea profundi TaxID=1658618 RepID=A0A2S7U4Z1_9BACT|nr:restriction endonuclease subunit S [Rubritalea profundi]PQJ30075.1 hypothetical protein BSZ32_17385 [Rubritalea profundi]